MTETSVTANVDRVESDGDDKEMLVVGAKSGFATLDPETGKSTSIRKVWTEADGEGKEQRYSCILDFRFYPCQQSTALPMDG